MRLECSPLAPSVLTLTLQPTTPARSLQGPGGAPHAEMQHYRRGRGNADGSTMSAVDRGASTIDGVEIVPLRRIPDERGTILHMLRSTDPHFIRFGEIYFTTIYAGVVKGWHRHTEMTLNYTCIAGRIKLVLYDEREGSPTHGTLMERFLGPDDYSLVVIPPGIWTGFKGMTESAIVANCATHPHDPARTERVDPFSDRIPYDWAVRNR
jgi:dTDP-4-dehydrorhamnose 3,5-epimerase